MRTILRRTWALGAATFALHLAPRAAAHAQTDYYNTDRGRPVQVEDAYAAERYAFELKLAPVRLEWTDGAPSWGIEPEIAYGLLPRTHLEIGVPIAYEKGTDGARRAGMAGLEVSLMHNLNAETRAVPALGLRADVLAPVGDYAPDRVYTTFTGMVTRTFSRLRIHLNGQYTVGAEPPQPPSPGPPACSMQTKSSRSPAETATSNSAPLAEQSCSIRSAGGSYRTSSQQHGSHVEELSRWLAGLAIDKAFPLRSLLLTAEVFARQPITPTEDLQYVAGAGMRWQVSPSVALDLGFGRRVDASTGPWYVTFGTAYAFGVSAFMPGGAR